MTLENLSKISSKLQMNAQSGDSTPEPDVTEFSKTRMKELFPEVRVFSTKRKTRNRTRLKETAHGDAILEMMSRLSDFLTEFRKQTGLTQSELADKLEVSAAKYTEVEKLRDINPAFGCSLHLLYMISRECDISLENLMTRLQGGRKMATRRGLLDEGVEGLFERVSMETKEEFILEFQHELDMLGWWMSLGTYLRSLPYKNRLEIEMQIHRFMLEKDSLSEDDLNVHRNRSRDIMNHLISLWTSKD